MKKFIVLPVLTTLLITACGSAQVPEKERFIDAYVETVCTLTKDISSLDNSEDINEDDLYRKLYKIYSDHGFKEVDSRDAVTELSKKYLTDVDVNSEIKQRTTDCMINFADDINMQEEESTATATETETASDTATTETK